MAPPPPSPKTQPARPSGASSKLDKEAIAKFVRSRPRKPLVLKPTDAPRYCNLALVFAKKKDDAGSAAAAELAARADPGSLDAWVLLASARARMRDYPGAQRAYERALKIDPQHTSSWTSLGELHLAQHQFKQATAALQKAMSLDPDATHPAGRRARALVGKAIAQLRD